VDGEYTPSGHAPAFDTRVSCACSRLQSVPGAGDGEGGRGERRGGQALSHLRRVERRGAAVAAAHEHHQVALYAELQGEPACPGEERAGEGEEG